uniref:thiol oxidase n=1 Tax=viral metagenome TaxID=1070528 RepID=A0A6C0E9R4_9ZZZZ
MDLSKTNFFKPDVWGPHYWFFLHTIAESYPNTPNSITKKKYYDLIQNMPLFIPVVEIGDKFSEFLDKYPVTPYLDNRDSFVRWVHFIHNKFNVLLGKEQISLPLALEKYRAEYKPKPIYLSEKINLRKHYIHAALILIFVVLIYIYYE